VNDSHLTGRPKVGAARLRLRDLPPDGSASLWLPLEPVNPGQKAAGEVLLDISYKPFVDDEQVRLGGGGGGGGGEGRHGWWWEVLRGAQLAAAARWWAGLCMAFMQPNPWDLAADSPGALCCMAALMRPRMPLQHMALTLPLLAPGPPPPPTLGCLTGLWLP
jgi:hypothetical protein